MFLMLMANNFQSLFQALQGLNNTYTIIVLTVL